MNIARLHAAATSSSLTDVDLAELISVAQSVPVETVQDPDGTIREVYGTTSEADDAMGLLLHAFRHLITSVASKYTSERMSFEDAQGYLYETFISAVRRYVPGSSLPFKAALRTILDRRLDDEARTSGLVVVRENVAARYRQIMAANDRDAAVAYAACKSGDTGMAADTFLAAHHAITGMDSLDAVHDRNSMHTFAEGAATGSRSAFESALTEPDPSPEDLTVQAEVVRYLFTLVPETHGTILRLAYGWNDVVTENIRVTAGLRSEGADLVMSDREVAQCTGSSRPTVARHRTAALATMRAALEETDAA